MKKKLKIRYASTGSEEEWERGSNKGIKTWADGSKYEGEWKYNRPPRLKIHFHGKGTYTYPDGSKWIGKFKDGEFQTQRKHSWNPLIFSSGDRYVGEGKNGKRHGQGTYTWADGDRYVQRYKNGVLMSEVLIPTRKRATH